MLVESAAQRLRSCESSMAWQKWATRCTGSTLECEDANLDSGIVVVNVYDVACMYVQNLNLSTCMIEELCNISTIIFFAAFIQQVCLRITPASLLAEVFSAMSEAFWDNVGAWAFRAGGGRLGYGVPYGP